MRLLLIALLLAPGSLFAGFVEDWAKLSTMAPMGYVGVFTPAPVQVDGKLDDPAWAKAPWTADFQDIEGTAKPKPRFRTRAKMVWDDKFLYIGVEMEEPHVWATITQHDAVIFQDPDFEVFIDPDGDRQNYYEFEMNALNTGWDLILPKAYIDGGPAKNEWEIPGLKTAVHIQGTINNPADRDQGWTLEIAMPWKVLGEHARQSAPPKEGDVWRISFSRVEWQIDIRDGKYAKVPGTKEDNWVWAPQGIIDMHRPENWGHVRFTRATTPPADFKPQRDPVADRLLAVYYAQKDFFKQHQRWAQSLSDLAILSRADADAVRLRATPTGYEASLSGMRIREDGLLESGRSK